MKREPFRRAPRFIIILSLFLAITISAQPAYGLNITIPTIDPSIFDVSEDFTDSNFKQAVWEWLGNSGTPGSFTKQDLVDRLPAKNYELSISKKDIKSLAGLQHFEGLKNLFCSNNQLSSLPSLPSTLNGLYCHENKLTSLPALPDTLIALSCSDNQISSLPPLPNGLINLFCEQNKLTSLPALPDTLKEFRCNENQLSSLPPLPSTLRWMVCGKNKLTSLPNLPNSLVTLICSNNQLTDMPSLPNALTSYLNCEYNYLNVFSDPLKARITACPAADKTYAPQYRLKYTGKDVRLAQKETIQLKANELKIQMSANNTTWGDAENADLSKLTFSSSNNAVAKVDTTGLITGQGAGTCSIYALLNGVDSSFTKTEIKVTVTDQVVSAPAAPSKLSCTVANDVVPTLTWTDNSDNETAFKIFRKKGNGTFSEVAQTPANVTKYVDISLTAGAVYTYRVCASNSIGDSAYSNEVDVNLSQQQQGSMDYSSASSWAVEELKKAEEYQLVTDKVKNNLKQDITRDEFCSIAVKLYETLSGKKALPAITNPFKDTLDSDILKAYELGIVKGVSADSFAPNNKITRQEICVMIYRAIKASKPNLDFTAAGVNKFADEDKIASWAINEVRYASKNNIMKGTGGNSISPLDNTSREQGIVLIKRTYETFKNQ